MKNSKLATMLGGWALNSIGTNYTLRYFQIIIVIPTKYYLIPIMYTFCTGIKGFGNLKLSGVLWNSIGTYESIWHHLSFISLLIRVLEFCRSDVRKVQEKQLYMESKGIVVFLMSVIFSLFALAMLFTDIIVNSVYIPEKSRKFCLMKSSWFFLFLSCSTTIVILSL